MPVLCRGAAEAPEEQVAWPCPPGHFALCASLLPSLLPSTRLMEAAPLGRLPGTPVATSFPGLGAGGRQPSRALRGARAENGITLASLWLLPESL